MTANTGPALSQAPATAPVVAEAPAIRATPDGKAVKTVIADGLGSTVESAVQNAAENALKQVVGSLIDTEKQVERRSQIANGIRSETRRVTSKVREYSQGFIQSFDVLETSQDGAIVRVAAKVGVRIDDFKAYIQKVAEGETIVERGLYPRVAAQAAVQQQQDADKKAIFVDRVLAPFLTNEGVSLSVGKLEPATNDRIPNCHAVYWCRDSNLAGWYIIPITLDIDRGVIKTIEQTVKQIASASNITSHDLIQENLMYTPSSVRGRSYPNQWPYYLSRGVVLQFPYGRSTSMNLYHVSFATRHGPSGAGSSFSKDTAERIEALFKKYYSTSINVEFAAADGEPVAVYNVSPYALQSGKDIHITPSWIRINAPRGGIALGDNQFVNDYVIAPATGAGQTFYLVVKVPPAALKDAVRVTVSLTQ